MAAGLPGIAFLVGRWFAGIVLRWVQTLGDFSMVRITKTGELRSYNMNRIF